MMNLKWDLLSFCYWIHFKLAAIVCKCLRGSTPDYLSEVHLNFAGLILTSFQEDQQTTCHAFTTPRHFQSQTQSSGVNYHLFHFMTAVNCYIWQPSKDWLVILRNYKLQHNFSRISYLHTNLATATCGIDTNMVWTFFVLLLSDIMTIEHVDFGCTVFNDCSQNAFVSLGIVIQCDIAIVVP